MEVTARPDVNVKNVEKWTPEVEQLLGEWHRRMFACQHAYYLEAERLIRWHLWLGIPAVVLSSVVGTALFATLENRQISVPARVAAALVSVAAAVFAALQTFLRLAESASAHGAAADWYAAIKRDIEELQALPPEERGHPKACLDALRKEINKAGQKSPQLRETLWMKAVERYGVDEPPPRSSASA